MTNGQTTSRAGRMLDLFARSLCFLVGPAVFATPLAMAAALPLLAVTITAIMLSRGCFDPRPMFRAALPWLPLLALLPLSALWSIDASASLLLSLRLDALFLCGLLLIHGLARLPRTMTLALIHALAWGFMIAAVVVISEAIDKQQIVHLFNDTRPDTILMSHYSRGSDFAAFLIPPLAFGLWRIGARKLAVAQLILGSAAILLGWELSSKLALVVGLAAGAIVLAVPMLRWGLVAALALAAITGPFQLPITLSADQTCWLLAHKPSGLHRLMIWNFVGGRIQERPWFGYGLDSSRRMPGGQDPIQIRRCDVPPGGHFAIDNQLLPLHPHNAALQIWLELGALGALLAFGALLTSLTRGLTQHELRHRTAQAMIVAFATAAIGPGFLSFGIWQEWWVSSLFIGAAATMALARLAVEPKDLRDSPENMLEHAARAGAPIL
jgi:exopolysaccharide production protein ExoQ